MEDKFCNVCGKTFSRGSESSGNFKRKKTCSSECSHQLMSLIRLKKSQKSLPRLCVTCGKEFIKRENEKHSEFIERQTCSKECTNKLISKNYTKYPSNKKCEICGKEFFKAPEEKPASFFRKKTCSKECFSLLRSRISKIILPDKNCSICGGEFSRRETEAAVDYRSRQTCSRDCGIKLISKNERKQTSPKVCVVCESTFSRRENESLPGYNSRKTCSTKCSFIIGIHSKEARTKSIQTHLEKYGVPHYCMTKECRTSYNIISKPNKEFAALLDLKGISYSVEHPLEKYSFDFKVDNTLVEINPFAFHNVTFSPFYPLEKTYHKDKTLCANKHGYRCIHVWDWDDTDKIISLFTPSQILYARNLEVKEVPQKECRDFLNKYHLQNDTRSQPIRLGLYLEDELIEVVTFGKPRYNNSYEYELLRLCTRQGYRVVGGINRLFLNFLRTYNPSSVISYCDMSKFKGDVYTELGFVLHKENHPSKHWYNPKTEEHFTDSHLRRHGFDRLVGKQYNISYGKGSSNEELMKSFGFVEIFDSGQNTFVFYA
jgi:hypothetical protein